jgi:hypothetical protein
MAGNFGRKLHGGSNLRYPAFAPRDVVRVEVDRLSHSIQFIYNGEPQGVAFTNLPSDSSIRLFGCVACKGSGGVVEIVDDI